MQEPSVRTSRLAIAGGIAAVLVVGGAGFLIGRSSVPPPVETTIKVAPAPAEPPSDKMQILDRGDIVSAAGRAADALASGGPAPQRMGELPGRRFSLSLPFGCTGPAGPDSLVPLRWSYDDATQAIHVHIAMTVWQPDEWGVNPTGGASVPQGFWVTRPWSSAETCPGAASDTAVTGTQPVTLPGQTLALVSFGAEAPRTEAYEGVVRIPRDKLVMTKGLRVRISGRIGHVPGNGPVRCVQPAGIDQQPICAVAAIFDEMVVDNPATGETIATWSIGKVGAVPPAQ